LELAKAIDKAIENNLIGLYHITNGESISKFDLLHLFNELRENKIKIVPNNEFKINKTLKKSNKFDFEVLDYKSMLQEMNVINYVRS
jgi:dTDP-4-dehydrorhamnose reductase